MTHDIPVSQNVIITQFADDTTLHIVHNNPKSAENLLNMYLVKILVYYN